MISFFKKKSFKVSKIQRKQSKTKKIVLYVALALLILGLGSLFSFKIFIVKNVDLKLRQIKCVEKGQLEKEIELSGKSIFWNFEDINGKLKAKHQCIENVTFKKKYPNSIEVEVNGKQTAIILKPYQKSIFEEVQVIKEASSSSESATFIEQRVNLNVESNQSAMLVDHLGKLFDLANGFDEGLSVYYLTPPVELGGLVSQERVINLLKIVDELRKNVFSFKRLFWEEDLLLVEANPQVLFSLNHDPLRQAASLQLILQKAKMDSKQVEKIDLRFSKPVVWYVPKKK